MTQTLRETETLKRGLRVKLEDALDDAPDEIPAEETGPARESAHPGEDAPEGPSIVLVWAQGRLPVATVTDVRGVVHKKALSPVDLLSLLDHSTTVSQLRQQQERITRAPPLPARTLMLDLLERPGAESYAITGWLPPASHAFVLDATDPRTNSRQRTTHLVPLPHIAYRALWHRDSRTVSDFGLALCSPDLQTDPRPDTPLYRYAFSNVYPGRAGSVCWPTLRNIDLDLHELPRELVLTFLATPNNADMYGVGRSQNSPHTDYADFLSAVAREGLHQHWLIPAQTTIEEFHSQTTKGNQAS